MLVGQLMSRDIRTCSPEDSLEAAARILWEHDVGVVPVISGARTVGMITDRDICMAAYTQGRPLREIAVSCAMSKGLHVAHPDEPLLDAMQTMREQQVRRLAIVDDEGKLQGLLSINDIVREASRPGGDVEADEALAALASIGQARCVAEVERAEVVLAS